VQTELAYPRSRISTRNCPTCRLSGGRLEIRYPIVATINGKDEVSCLGLSCSDCGYTMLFDVELDRSSPYRDRSTVESFP